MEWPAHLPIVGGGGVSIFVSAHALSCDVSNIADDDEGPDESAPIQFHLPPTPCFEHVENIDIAISSG